MASPQNLRDVFFFFFFFFKGAIFEVGLKGNRVPDGDQADYKDL